MASFNSLDSVEGYGKRGMDPRQFAIGLDMLLAGELGELRGERGPDRPDDHGPDNRGGETVELNPNHRYPPGLGGIGLGDVRFDRDRDLIAA